MGHDERAEPQSELDSGECQGKRGQPRPRIGRLGEARQYSPTLLARYTFLDNTSRIRPYVAAGGTYVWYGDVNEVLFSRAVSTKRSNAHNSVSLEVANE